MHKTRTPTSLRASLLPGVIALAMLPVTAHGQSPNNNVLRLTAPIAVVQPNLRLAVPTVTLNPAALQPLAPNIARIAPTLAPIANPEIRANGIARSVGAAGLGRLVAPGNQDSGIVVGRIGSTGGTTLPNLTVDFDGDGLINFEIAPGIVDIPTENAGPGADALGGLVGQHIAMATGTADRVLDSVINVTGVVPAATFEVTNGTVVLGGFQPQDIAVSVDISIPDSPKGTDGPKTDDGRDPGRRPEQQDGEHATHDPVNDDPVGGDPGRTVEICPGHVCDGGIPSDPKPEPGQEPGREPGRETGQDLGYVLNFTGFRRAPAPESAPTLGVDDFLNASIMLPLRGREEPGDQFSNYGNEEIW